eukprot:4305246-Pyramimonas_sp.AAC.1
MLGRRSLSLLGVSVAGPRHYSAEPGWQEPRVEPDCAGSGQIKLEHRPRICWRQYRLKPPTKTRAKHYVPYSLRVHAPS